MESKREALNYRVAVKGVWGRNRKVKYETWKLEGYTGLAEKAPLEAVLAAARAKLAELKVKSGSYVAVLEDPVTFETCESGGKLWVSELYVLFSSVKLHEEVVA